MTTTVIPVLESVQQVTATKEISKEIFYPSEDGEPFAEISVHADAIIATVAVLYQITKVCQHFCDLKNKPSKVFKRRSGYATSSFVGLTQIKRVYWA